LAICARWRANAFSVLEASFPQQNIVVGAIGSSPTQFRCQRKELPHSEDIMLRLRFTTSLEERLAEEARRWREQAKLLPPGPERDELMRKANQADAACHLNQWLASPALIISSPRG
jgi:hypothetical protein